MRVPVLSFRRRVMEFFVLFAYLCLFLISMGYLRFNHERISQSGNWYCDVPTYCYLLVVWRASQH